MNIHATDNSVQPPAKPTFNQKMIAQGLEGLVKAATAANQRGNFGDAATLLRALVLLGPTEAGHRLALARAEFNAGDLGAGMEELNSLLELDPDRYQAVVLASQLDWKKETEAPHGQAPTGDLMLSIAKDLTSGGWYREGTPELMEFVEDSVLLAVKYDQDATGLGTLKRLAYGPPRSEQKTEPLDEFIR